MSDDVQKKIAELEAEMARTQKNKATNYHLGTLKAKIAKLKSELINGPGGKSAGSKDAGRGFDVTKSGDTRIGLVGFPSVGKVCVHGKVMIAEVMSELLCYDHCWSHHKA